MARSSASVTTAVTTPALSRADDRRVAPLHRFPHRRRVVCLFEQVRLRAERGVCVRMLQLWGDGYHVQAFGDQERGERAGFGIGFLLDDAYGIANNPAIRRLRADFDLERSYGLAAPPELITHGVRVKIVGNVPRTL